MTRPVDVVCPTCDAQPLAPCVEAGRVLPYCHPDRSVAARTETMAGLGRQPPIHRGRWRDEKPAANGRKERT